MLRQKDVIGEWEPAPLAEGGFLYKGRRWVNGLLWSHIDANMVLRKKPTKTLKHGVQIEFDLKFYPAILEEIAKVPAERRIGPMIVSEHTREPYKYLDFFHSDVAQDRRRRRRSVGGVEHGRARGRHIGERRRRSWRGRSH